MEAIYQLCDLIPEIVSDRNMWDSYDYVVTHLECPQQRGKYAPDKMPKERQDFQTQEAYDRYLGHQRHAAEVRLSIITTLKNEISQGTFRIPRDKVRDIHVTDGPKERDCQAPIVPLRIGCHAIMVVVEKYITPLFINNTASSIKGRGMHWLHNIIADDIKNAPEETIYFYQSDISKFYDSIDQEGMKAVIRRYISDPLLLPMLDDFITLLPSGLSKGLRSSQPFANLFLSDIDHIMQDACFKYDLDGNPRYLYYRYCDDVVLLGPDKKALWKLRDLYVAETAKIGLRVKPNEAVRPLSVGLDFLGYVQYPDHALIRKRIKQNAARKLAQVQSRKRRQQIVGSFKGMACHADCKNLFYILTHHRMKKFSEMGVAYAPADGKKRFPGKVTRLSSLQNKDIEIHDYETDIKTSQGEGRYLVSFKDAKSGEWGKFFTSSEEMKNILDQISDMEDGFPFQTVILSEVFDGNKVKYKFS